jgi:hypothetical protein
MTTELANEKLYASEAAQISTAFSMKPQRRATIRTGKKAPANSSPRICPGEPRRRPSATPSFPRSE